MPKAKRIRSAALEAQLTRHQPLGQVIAQDAARQGGGKLRNKSKWKARRSSTGAKDNNDKEEEELLDTKTSQRILELSKHQQLEMETEGAAADVEERRRRRLSSKSPSSAQQRKRRNDDDDDDDDEKEEEDNEEWEDAGDGIVRDNDRYISVAEGTLSPEDEAMVNAMMMMNDVGGGSQQQPPRKSLADLILEKIEEKESAVLASSSASRPDGAVQEPGSLPPKVVHVYTEIGKLLSRYTSGKLPKAFKVIPSLTHWEDVLYICRPDLWTPQAMYAATRIFASNLNPQMAQRFYNLVLLDAVRADIQRNKKLNYHYYMALKKAVYKPAAFFKGILLPLCHDQGCSLREAAIVASVLQRVSIPVHHAAVAIHKLAQQNTYTGATSIFLRTLLNKKYSLPKVVVASLIRHFAAFTDDPDRELPVLWHQALLVFVERYKTLIQSDPAAREALRRVMKVHYHHKITPEIRRELFGAVAAWKEEHHSASSATAAAIAEDTMQVE